MVGRKHLRTVAGGLLGTFTSRNNDIDGYWGLGVLRLYAEQRDVETLEIDLLSNVSAEPTGSPLRICERSYRSWFCSALSHRLISPKELSSAYIRIRFSTFDEFPNIIRSTRGEPYVCVVSITSEHGTEYSISRVGVCAGHDPRKELKSIRECV